MKNYTIGVYIGNRVLQCVAVSNNKLEKKIHSSKVYYYKEKNADADKFINWLFKRIETFIKKSKLKNYTIYAAYNIDTFVLEVGSLSNKETEQSLTYQIQEKLNILNTKSLKYKWTYVNNTQENKSACITAMDTGLYTKLLDDTIISTLDDTSIAVIRAINNNKEPVIVVDLQKSNIRVTLVKSGKPVYTESLKIDSKNTNVLSGYLQRYEFDARNEELTDIKNYEESILNNNSAGLLNIDRKALELEPVVSEVVQFIRRCIFAIQIYLEAQAIQFQVDKAYFTYDETLYKEIIGYIQKEMEIKLEPFLYYKENELNRVFGEEVSEYEGYDIALALSIIDGDNDHLRELSFKRNTRALEKFMSRLNVGMFAGIIAVSCILAYSTNIYNEAKKQIDTKVSSLQSTLQQRTQELNTYKAENESNLNMNLLFDTLKELREYNIDVMTKLQYCVVNSIIISDVVLNKDMLLQGESANYSDIGYFVVALKNTYKTEITNIETVTVGELYKFKLVVNLGRNNYEDEFSFQRYFQ